MALSTRLLPLLLVSLTAASWAWEYGERPYSQSADTSTGYSQGVAGSNGQQGGGRPPARVNTGYGGTGTGQGSDAWNRAQRPPSQFDYTDTYGNARTETLDCGKDLYVSSNQIIDIQSSVQFGAQLLDGVYSYSFDRCVDACCNYEGCDLALYKTDGMSDTGKTCYFVHCGLLDHCRMVSNDGFTAGFLIQKPNYGEILDDHSTKQKTDVPSPATQHPPSTTNPVSITTLATTATPTTTPTQPETITTATTERPDDDTTTALPVTETHETTSPNKTEKPPTEDRETMPTANTPTQQSSAEENTSSSVATSNTPPTSSEVATQSTSSSGATSTSKVAIDNAMRDQKKGDEDKCAKDGCAGTGLIVVSIIGTLIIVVLLVVAVVIGRRIYKMKTRRQYRNVDYLINGMYT